MNKYFLFFILLLLISCKPYTIRRNGGLYFEIEVTSGNPTNDLMEKTIQILKNRIDYFCFNNPKVQFDAQTKLIKIELPLEKDTALYMDLILTKGSFYTLETFENQDFYPYIMEINNLFKKNNNFGLILHDTTNILREFPLFSIIYPAVALNNNLVSGPVIGYSKPMDTTKVLDIFRISAVRKVLPA